QPQGKAGSLSMDDLKKVCAGEAQSDAASYVKQASNTSKLYYFEKRYEDWRWPGRGPGMPELPAWWTDFKEPANTQLVVCVDLTDKTKVQDCRYKGGGDGISAYEATITLTLYESKTGRKVDTNTFKKGAPTCPVVKMGRQQEGLFPAYSKELKTFLAPHVGGPT
ncbi:MAG: hypothetical protein KAI66_04200, partial [Lentisphaeria bacterium]|nr:hypothetical protein [Lentisphaeria bacterium]